MLRLRAQYYCLLQLDFVDRIGACASYFKFALCQVCFNAVTSVCTERTTPLVEDHCVALTDDDANAVATLLNVHAAGVECRLSQADASWVRNPIADGESFLTDSLRDVP